MKINKLSLAPIIILALVGCNEGNNASTPGGGGPPDEDLKISISASNGLYVGESLVANLEASTNTDIENANIVWKIGNRIAEGNEYLLGNNDWPGAVTVCASLDETEVCSDPEPILAKHPLANNLNSRNQQVRAINSL